MATATFCTFTLLHLSYLLCALPLLLAAEGTRALALSKLTEHYSCSNSDCEDWVMFQLSRFSAIHLYLLVFNE